VGDIGIEDVLRFDHGGRTFAICRDAQGDVHAIDGHCSHENAHLAEGLVRGHTIECPKHNGRFDIRTGEAVRIPARVRLRTYPIKILDERIYIAIEDDVA
jgi:3-phenylpropionate/trans-cinnamate dioxygenase ferredoxin subunit